MRSKYSKINKGIQKTQSLNLAQYYSDLAQYQKTLQNSSQRLNNKSQNHEKPAKIKKQYSREALERASTSSQIVNAYKNIQNTKPLKKVPQLKKTSSQMISKYTKMACEISRHHPQVSNHLEDEEYLNSSKNTQSIGSVFDRVTLQINDWEEQQLKPQQDETCTVKMLKNTHKFQSKQQKNNSQNGKVSELLKQLKKRNQVYKQAQKIANRLKNDDNRHEIMRRFQSPDEQIKKQLEQMFEKAKLSQKIISLFHHRFPTNSKSPNNNTSIKIDRNKKLYF